MSARDQAVIEPIARALRPENPQAWPVAFGRATALGAAVVPPLRAALARETGDYRVRLLWIVTLAAADPDGSVPLLLERFGSAGSGLDDIRERLLIGMLLAMGPERADTAPALVGGLRRAGRGRQPEVQEVVATLLALARFPNAEIPTEALRLDASDVGIAAAARFARPGVPDPARAAWLASEAPRGGLVQRAMLLRERVGAVGAPRSAPVLGALGRPGDGAAEVRLAAALAIATAGDPEAWVERLGAEIREEHLVGLATSAGFRAALFRRGRLGPPSARLAPVDRGRLALAFALATDADGLRDTRSSWSVQDELARIICLGVAWRAFRGDPAIDRTWLGALPDEPELEWVRLALGDAALHRTRTFDDAELDAAFLLAARGALPAAAAADVLEGALWRAGIHPEAARIAAEQRLIRDLLLSGSNHGRRAPDGVGGDGYFPAGLYAGDDVFEIGYAAWRYFSAPGPRRRPPRRRRPHRGPG